MKTILSIIALWCLTQTLTIQAQSPKYEVRAVWLTTIGGIDWPHSYAQSTTAIETQKKELRDILDKLQHANINTILLQTRIRGTVIYPSAIEPWDGCLSGIPGQSPGYDALQFAIEECHRRGMECHAWVVTIPVGKWNTLGCKRLRNKYPSLIRRIGEEGYMNPEQETTARYLSDICDEIVRNYDIDGIHLDYIRYQETWKIKIPRSTGREHISRIVQRIHDTVKARKPWVKMSCSPIGKYDDLRHYSSHGWNAYTKGCQDAQEWLQQGWMDALFPMMYFQGNQFFPFAIDWQENAVGRMVSAGLGIYMLSPQERNWDLEVVKREMSVCRQLGLGHTFFRSKFFTDNIKGVYDFVCDFNRIPALVPPMTWYGYTAPSAPSYLKVNRGNTADDIEWYGAKDYSDSPYLLYNLYATTEEEPDINNPQQLVATRITSKRLRVPHPEGVILNYALTASNRYGQESTAAAYSQSLRQQPIVSKLPFLKNDGNHLLLPRKTSVLDANYVTIETLQGKVIATEYYQPGQEVSIRTLPEGIYILKSLGRKGVTHRLGFFLIRR